MSLSIIPRSIFLQYYAVIEVDISKKHVSWRDLISRFAKVSGAISFAVLRMKGFQKPQFDPIVDLVRLFPESMFVRRIDRDPLKLATKSHKLSAQYRPTEHIFINPVPYAKHALRINEEQILQLMKMVAVIGRAARDSPLPIESSAAKCLQRPLTSLYQSQTPRQAASFIVRLVAARGKGSSTISLPSYRR